MLFMFYLINSNLFFFIGTVSNHFGSVLIPIRYYYVKAGLCKQFYYYKSLNSRKVLSFLRFFKLIILVVYYDWNGAI